MPSSLTSSSFLKLEDFDADQLRSLIDQATHLKAEKSRGTEQQRLAGLNLALIFEKTSTRTRAAFEVAAYDQGARVSVLDPAGSQMGDKESVRDTARVLGRMYDGIAYRGSSQAAVEELARFAGVPVWNGLTDQYHPTQILADVLTMMEHCEKPIEQQRVCYLGDARFNMGNSLTMGAAKLGFDLRIAAPEAYWPGVEHRERCARIAAESGAELHYTELAAEGVQGVDYVYTDVWVSMGEDPASWDRRVEALLPYRVDLALLEAAHNSDVKFLHCLPAFHDNRTTIGEAVASRFGLDCLEVSDEVFESSASVVFDQAENRLHTIKALLVSTLVAR
jgi:ornithine carbamoyltransferase